MTPDATRTAREEQLRAALDLLLSQGPSFTDKDWAAAAVDMLPLLTPHPDTSPAEPWAALAWLIDHSNPMHSATCAALPEDDPCICGVSDEYGRILALRADTSPSDAAKS